MFWEGFSEDFSQTDTERERERERDRERELLQDTPGVGKMRPTWSQVGEEIHLKSTLLPTILNIRQTLKSI